MSCAPQQLRLQSHARCHQPPVISPTKSSPLRDRAELLEFASDAIILTDARRHHHLLEQRGLAHLWLEKEGSAWEKSARAGSDGISRRHARSAIAPARPSRIGKARSQQTRRDGTRIVVLSRWTIDGTRPDSPRLEINTDITAQKEKEKALREARNVTGASSWRILPARSSCTPTARS